MSTARRRGASCRTADRPSMIFSSTKLDASTPDRGRSEDPGRPRSTGARTLDPLRLAKLPRYRPHHRIGMSRDAGGVGDTGAEAVDAEGRRDPPQQDADRRSDIRVADRQHRRRGQRCQRRRRQQPAGARRGPPRPRRSAAISTRRRSRAKGRDRRGARPPACREARRPRGLRRRPSRTAARAGTGSAWTARFGATIWIGLLAAPALGRRALQANLAQAEEVFGCVRKAPRAMAPAAGKRWGG